MEKKVLGIKVSDFISHMNRPRKIRQQIRQIKINLELHGYEIEKLTNREVWKIGEGNEIWLLGYHPKFKCWVLFPSESNLQNIISSAIEKTNRLMS